VPIYNTAIDINGTDGREAFNKAGFREPGGSETSRDRVLSDDEIRTLWPIMEETGYPFGCLAQFLLVTAQRRDEGSNMLWSEISGLDGENPVWTIPASKNKGGRLHEVPLSPLRA
jgi:integrase